MSTDPNLKLDLHAELRDGKLVVRYSVENLGGFSLYLLNRVPEHSMKTSPDVIYIEHRRDRKVVFLYKDIPPVPPDFNPPMPIAPYVTAVRPLKRFEEVVHIDTPVREVHAYLPAPQGGTRVMYAGLELALGYYWEIPGTKEREIEVVPGVKALIPQPPPRTQTKIKKVVSRLVPLQIPVLEG